VIVYTHSGRFDFADDDNDFVADIQMAVAKKEVKRIRKRLKRGRDARARSGGFFGPPPIGYKITFVEIGDGRKPISDLEIDPNSAEVVKEIFRLTIDECGGNLSEVRRQMKDYRTRKGNPFSFNALKLIATNQIYAGLVQYGAAEVPVHRPDLQIIPIDRFQRAQEMVKSRSEKHNFDGKRGRYIFTGYVVCGDCGGKMVASKGTDGRVVYSCVDRREQGECKKGKTYSEKLILPPVIDVIANIINRYCDLDIALNEALNQYGKTVTEEALEAAIKGEMAVVESGKERLINAMADGIFTQEEVSAKLAELRERAQELTIELASVNEKAQIRDSFLAALETLKSRDIQVTLTMMARERPLAFRQLMGMIFLPNSLRVRTYRKPGTANHWLGDVLSYELTDPIREYMANLSSVNEFL
jgi:site-specific DNA recombinase